MKSAPVDHTKIPSFPKITARITGFDQGEVAINGIRCPVTGQDLAQVRARITETITATAAKLGRPVHTTTADVHGVWSLVVHPDGTVEEDTSTGPDPTVLQARQRSAHLWEEAINAHNKDHGHPNKINLT